MPSFDPERITYFAETDARGKRVPFGIRAKDRTKHVYVIGKSGMGKSTLLENMAVQDIKNGEGFTFIDPHGQSADAIMRNIPKNRVDDVLYFNPSDLSRPIAYNFLEHVEPDKRALVVAGLMSVFKKIWVDAWSARMEYILQYTLLALLEYPGATLLGVNRMLSDKGYREDVVAHVTDPGVKAFWKDEFANYSDKYMQEAGDSIKNKIGQFTSNPVIRNIVGQSHTSFNLRKIMDERKILIVNLSKGLIGESNANLLGSMLTTSIYLAAMSRADLSPREMAEAPNFYFYVDEFQSFANATFANILSESRKYKLNLTIAHQYVDQMEEDVRNAVFGNVGTTITFRVGPLDAEILEKLFMPEFTATDMVTLGYTQIYLTLMIDGIGSPPFSARTLPPIQEPDISYYETAIARSREHFGTSRNEAESAIALFYEKSFGEKKGKGKEKVTYQKKQDYKPPHEGWYEHDEKRNNNLPSVPHNFITKEQPAVLVPHKQNDMPVAHTRHNKREHDHKEKMKQRTHEHNHDHHRAKNATVKRNHDVDHKTPYPQGNDLKSALAEALATITLPREEQEDKILEVVVSDEKGNSVDTAKLHQEGKLHSVSHDEHDSVVRKNSSAVTPKALAHMMRITLKDKKRRPQ